MPRYFVKISFINQKWSTLIISIGQCPPQDISSCKHGFKCEIGMYGGCYYCQCLPDECGYSDSFVVSLKNYWLFTHNKIYFKRRAPCIGNCKKEDGLTCTNSFGGGYMGTYCAPNYSCEEYGSTTDYNFY